MALDFLKKKDGEDETLKDDFVELDAEISEGDKEVIIRAATLEDFSDVEPVQEHLRNDHIVWVNISPLKNKDMTDLKRAVNRLKKTVKSVEGDMAGVDEEWIVVCPSFAKIERTEEIDEEE